MDELSFKIRNILAIDLKSFYASVECIDRHLDPFKVPLIVCDPDRGGNSIVMAVSPYLKAKGIPSRCRRKDVPDIAGLIVAVPRMARYLEVSATINDIYLRHVDEKNLHVYSIDESFLDVTNFLRCERKTPREIAETIIGEVKRETGLTVCAGIGDNLFMAKAAMDIEAKHNPDFIAEWHRGDIAKKLWPVSPLSKIWGIGERMEIKLNRLGLYTAGEVAAFDPHELVNRFGVIGGEIWLHCNGVDRAIIEEKRDRPRASMSVGQQLHLGASGEDIHLLAREMGRELAIRLARENLSCRGICLWMSGDDLWSNHLEAGRGISTSTEIVASIERMLEGRIPARIFRIGAVAYDLSPSSFMQLDLETDWKKREKDEALDRTMARIKDTFGPASIFRLSALHRGSTHLRRAIQIGGHKA